MAALICFSPTADTVIVVTRHAPDAVWAAVPNRRRCADVIGTITTSSWLPPNVDVPPFSSITPTTLNGTRSIFIFWPIGSWLPNKVLAVSVPSTATRATVSNSRWLMKPSAGGVEIADALETGRRPVHRGVGVVGAGGHLCAPVIDRRQPRRCWRSSPGRQAHPHLRASRWRPSLSPNGSPSSSPGPGSRK